LESPLTQVKNLQRFEKKCFAVQVKQVGAKTLQPVRLCLGDDEYTMRRFLTTWQNAKNRFSDFLSRFSGVHK
jgi:hypothetical protein